MESALFVSADRILLSVGNTIGDFTGREVNTRAKEKLTIIDLERTSTVIALLMSLKNQHQVSPAESHLRIYGS